MGSTRGTKQHHAAMARAFDGEVMAFRSEKARAPTECTDPECTDPECAHQMRAPGFATRTSGGESLRPANGSPPTRPSATPPVPSEPTSSFATRAKLPAAADPRAQLTERGRFTTEPTTTSERPTQSLYNDSHGYIVNQLPVARAQPLARLCDGEDAPENRLGACWQSARASSVTRARD